MADPKFTTISLTPEQIARFWSKVEKTGEFTCWLFITKGSNHGHYQFCKEYVHRISYMLEYGPIPEGMWVLHKCSMPRCVNPLHLYLGTQIENMKDMIEQGRAAKGNRHGSKTHPGSTASGDRNGARTHPERVSKGDKHPCAKLNTEKVKEIKRAIQNGEVEYRVVNRFALEFEVSRRTIADVISGKNWKQVTL